MIYVSQYGSLVKAVAVAPPGSVVVVDADYTAVAGDPEIFLNKPGVTYQFTAQYHLGALGGNGVTISAPGVRLVGIPGIPTFLGSTASTIFLVSGADDVELDGIGITGYNQSNQNGAAAIFALQTTLQPVRRLRVRRCHTTFGNGNGLRVGGVQGGEFTDSVFEWTAGNSAEGISVNGSDLLFDRVTLSSAFVTGLLVWGGKSPMDNLVFRRLTIKNSSQAVLPPPNGCGQFGNNQAMQINGQNGRISGVLIEDCAAYDDQATPTQAYFLDIRDDGLGAQLENVTVRNNRWWGNRSNNVGVTIELSQPMVCAAVQTVTA